MVPSAHHYFWQESDRREPIDISTEKMEIYDRSDIEIRYFKELLGGGLILAKNGEHWRAARNVSAVAFQAKALRDVVPLVAKRTDILLRHLQAAAGQPVNMQAELQKLTFDTLKGCSPLELISKPNCKMRHPLPMRGRRFLIITCGELLLAFPIGMFSALLLYADTNKPRMERCATAPQVIDAAAETSSILTLAT
eukprot:TRINITY_DN1199_c1_g1_i1.p1 TRINITY_DN1199_c1_g1~~TRINITY_DN1199_c1_g1_i1.p1  ORF type:complete len:195 (+),score=24.57 TRINITY_DN1199_c1_g1_i1:83-667(+)